MFKEEYEGFGPIGVGEGIGCEEIGTGVGSEEEWI